MNNTPDYKNNLAFAPTSADDLNTKGRDSDVLIKALDKCERLQKQLDIAINGINESIKDYKINGACYEDCVGFYMTGTLKKTLERIKEQSDVAED